MSKWNHEPVNALRHNNVADAGSCSCTLPATRGTCCRTVNAKQQAAAAAAGWAAPGCDSAMPCTRAPNTCIAQVTARQLSEQRTPGLARGEGHWPGMLNSRAA